MASAIPVRGWKGRRLSFGGSKEFWRIWGASQRSMTFKKAGTYARVSLKLVRETGPRRGRTSEFVFKSSDVADMEISDTCNIFLVRRRSKRAVSICIFVSQQDRDDGTIALAA